MDIKANENELQKAIEDITKNGANATPGASELEAQIQSQMGVPPVPPVAEATTVPVMPDASEVPAVGATQEAPVVAPAPDLAATVPEVSVAEPSVPVPETTATEVAPAINPEPVAATPEPVESAETIDTVKGAIVRELYPLLDQVEVPAEEKFTIIKEMMEETGDKSMIVKGYDAAKGIADEKAKAEALLYLFENA